MSEAFRSLAAAHPGAEAVVTEWRTLTRAELNRLADGVAHVLAAEGVTAGGRVGWMMGNRVEVIAVALAAQRLGAVLAPLSYRSAPAELERLLAVARPAMVVCEAATRGALAGIASARLLDVDDPAFGMAVTAAPDSPARPAARGPERLGAGASLLFTSGTTGVPKGALRTRGDPRLAASIAAGFGFTGATRYLASGPLYHSGPGTCALMAISLGGVAGLRPRFEPAGWLRFARRHRVTASFITPTQLRRLVEEIERGADPPTCLTNVVVSGEPFPAELKRRAAAALGPCLIDCYGCTELGPLAYMPAAEMLSRPTSCGRPFPGVEIAAFDGDRRLDPGEAGVLRVRTPLAFDGYLGPGGRLDRCGEWATVGDVGRIDQEGYVHLIDRADGLIISGGVNVFPADVEAVLVEHPCVSRCAVVGLPDERWGQVVCALVVAGGPLTVDGVRDWLRGRIADDKRPRRLFRVRDLPTTATGKMSRAALSGVLAAAEELPASGPLARG